MVQPPQRPIGGGRLAEIPFGVKDIVETRGLATEYGSPIYKGRIGTADAAIVRDMRQRGAILPGKTQTTAFAYRTPPPTRNPRNQEHTPGGSSSGSAAAVAAGMVPVAIGGQTLGSVLRPASYCGVTGFKASYGLFNGGRAPREEPRHARVLLLIRRQTCSHCGTHWDTRWADRGFCWARLSFSPEVEPAMVAAADPFSVATERRQHSTHRYRRHADAALRSATTVVFYEGARFHEERLRSTVRLADLADLVRDGLQIRERYDAARRYIVACQARVNEMFKVTPVILVPAPRVWRRWAWRSPVMPA